jgi:hypothetical protein
MQSTFLFTSLRAAGAWMVTLLLFFRWAGWC